MGITGGLVKNVFHRNRSVRIHERNVRSNVMEKRKWNSVRSYLCGDEFNSVLAEEDSASVKSSEVTVTQPVLEEGLTNKEDKASEDSMKDENVEEIIHLSFETKRKERAAVVIQSAFRSFLARSQNEGTKQKDDKQGPVEGMESPSRESLCTSIEVQTGNSEVFSVQEEKFTISCRVRQKLRTQLLNLKEEWDDSTVSSNISKMRIQNRLEATTRRERALAYAFSQQLRICSKKKQSKSNDMEANMGWSWLERWMATRFPESSSVESHPSKPLEPAKSNQRVVIGRRIFDIVGEEKESCGSNEVSVQSDYFSANASREKDGSKPTKNRLKTTKSISKRKTVPSHQIPECMTRQVKKIVQ